MSIPPYRMPYRGRPGFDRDRMSPTNNAGQISYFGGKAPFGYGQGQQNPMQFNRMPQQQPGLYGQQIDPGRLPQNMISQPMVQQPMPQPQPMQQGQPMVQQPMPQPQPMSQGPRGLLSTPPNLAMRENQLNRLTNNIGEGQPTARQNQRINFLERRIAEQIPRRRR